MDGDGEATGLCFPYDVLLHILGGLPCRALAESRRVCRSWRSIVDTLKLLLPHFFPRGSCPSIFTRNYGSDIESSFFAPSVPVCSAPYVELMLGLYSNVLCLNTSSSRFSITAMASFSSRAILTVITSVTRRRYDVLSCHYR